MTLAGVYDEQQQKEGFAAPACLRAPHTSIHYIDIVTAMLQLSKRSGRR